MQHVVPELSNQEHSFLRHRAAWIIGMFSDLPWSTPANAQACLQALMMCLRDAELPVKVSAAATFQHVLGEDGWVFGLLLLCFTLVWFGLVWSGLVWFGLVWFGLVWFGLVWFGLLWLGVA